MPSRYEETIYQLLADEPVTPNEVARKLGISHKTAQRVLMHLALTKDEVRYKNSGRIHMFWKTKEMTNVGK
jgi:Mn-dependent DtxR family transcriptional regulator